MHCLTRKEEETMKEIIMDVHEETPKEIGRGILERVLGYSDYHARDDMTVLVAVVEKIKTQEKRRCIKILESKKIYMTETGMNSKTL